MTVKQMLLAMGLVLLAVIVVDRCYREKGGKPSKTYPSVLTAPDKKVPHKAAESFPPHLEWMAVQDDGGAADSHWGVIAGPTTIIRKTIHLDMDPGPVRAAKVCYLIAVDPYCPRTKSSASGPTSDIKWADILINVNGREILCASAIAHITKGWHEINVPPECLVRGDNLITFSWAPAPEGNPGRFDYGYAYFGIDTRAIGHGRSDSSDDSGSTFSTATLRPGSKPGKLWQGEYMIRLKLAIPLE